MHSWLYLASYNYVSDLIMNSCRMEILERASFQILHRRVYTEITFYHRKTFKLKKVLQEIFDATIRCFEAIADMHNLFTHS